MRVRDLSEKFVGHGRGVEVPIRNAIGDLIIFVGEGNVAVISDRATDDQYYNIDTAVVHECVRGNGNLSFDVLTSASKLGGERRPHRVPTSLISVIAQVGACAKLLPLGLSPFACSLEVVDAMIFGGYLVVRVRGWWLRLRLLLGLSRFCVSYSSTENWDEQ